jgi:hypothetical protein
MLVISNVSFGQFNKKLISKIPSNYSDLIETRENEKGMLMSYSKFSEGQFELATEKEEASLMTTMLLGSATFLFDLLKEKYVSFQPIVLKPNGFTSTTFEIEFKYEKGSIYILRKMIYGSLLNPVAAENPNNYGLIYGFDIEDPVEKERIINFLIQYFNQNEVENKKIELLP